MTGELLKDLFDPDNDAVRAQLASFLIACFKRANEATNKQRNRVVSRSFDLSSASGDGSNGQIDIVMPDDWQVATAVIENPNASGSLSVYRDGIITGLPYATVPLSVAKVVPVAPQTKRLTVKWNPAVVNNGIMQVWLLESALGYDEFGVNGSGGGGTVANPSVSELISGANGNVATVDTHGSQITKIADNAGSLVDLLDSIAGHNRFPVSLYADNGLVHSTTVGTLQGQNIANVTMLSALNVLFGTNRSNQAIQVLVGDENSNGNGNGAIAVNTGGSDKTSIAAGTAGNTTIKNGRGRCCKIIVLATGTNAMSFTDNGVTFFTIPASAPVGTIYDIQTPCGTNIVAVGNAANPGVSVQFI